MKAFIDHSLMNLADRNQGSALCVCVTNWAQTFLNKDAAALSRVWTTDMKYLSNTSGRAGYVVTARGRSSTHPDGLYSPFHSRIDLCTSLAVMLTAETDWFLYGSQVSHRTSTCLSETPTTG